jgi:hypothetical protein
LKRNDRIIEHPTSKTIFLSEDIAYIMGKSEQISNARELFGENAG